MVKLITTDPVTTEQEPQWLQLSDIHRGGLEAVTKMSGEVVTYAVLGLLVTAGQHEEFSIQSINNIQNRCFSIFDYTTKMSLT